MVSTDLTLLLDQLQFNLRDLFSPGLADQIFKAKLKIMWTNIINDVTSQYNGRLYEYGDVKATNHLVVSVPKNTKQLQHADQSRVILHGYLAKGTIL